jgi:hypothetical protein
MNEHSVNDCIYTVAYSRPITNFNFECRLLIVSMLDTIVKLQLMSRSLEK